MQSVAGELALRLISREFSQSTDDTDTARDQLVTLSNRDRIACSPVPPITGGRKPSTVDAGCRPDHPAMYRPKRRWKVSQLTTGR
jgi:hypothetical protein